MKRRFEVSNRQVSVPSAAAPPSCSDSRTFNLTRNPPTLVALPAHPAAPGKCCIRWFPGALLPAVSHKWNLQHVAFGVWFLPFKHEVFKGHPCCSVNGTSNCLPRRPNPRAFLPAKYEDSEVSRSFCPNLFSVKKYSRPRGFPSHIFPEHLAR